MSWHSLDKEGSDMMSGYIQEGLVMAVEVLLPVYA